MQQQERVQGYKGGAMVVACRIFVEFLNFALDLKIWYNICVAVNCDEEFENFISFKPSWRSGSAFP